MKLSGIADPRPRFRLSIMECPVARLRGGDRALIERGASIDSSSATYPVIDDVPDMRMPSNRDATSYDEILPEFTSGKADPRTLTSYGLSESDIAEHVVLVAGSGSGMEIDQLLAMRPKEIHAIDFSGFIRTVAKPRPVFAYQADLCNLPFKDGVFNVIMAAGIIQHTRSPEIAVREMIRCLKPGGTLIVGNMYHEGLHNRRVAIDRYRYMFHKRKVAEAKRALRLNAALYHLLAHTGLWRLHRRFPLPKILEYANSPSQTRRWYYENALDYYLPRYRHVIPEADFEDFCAQAGATFTRTPKGYRATR